MSCWAGFGSTPATPHGPSSTSLAHDFDDIDALTDCVAREWSAFNAPYFRLRTAPELLADRPDVILDETIHVARYRDMTPAYGPRHPR